MTSETEIIDVIIRHRGVEVKFSGSTSEVIRGIMEYLGKVYPTFELVSKLVFTPDVVTIMEAVKETIIVTGTGPVLLHKEGLTTSEAIALILVGSWIGNRVNKLSRDSLTAQEISRAISKATKTVGNQLPSMTDKGLVDRAGRGEYRITEPGIKLVLDEVVPRIKGGLKVE